MALTVFELRNRSLMELYVGMDELPFDKLRSKHLRQRPKALAHWDYARHQILYSEIEHRLPDEDARVFFESYAKMVYVPDWTTLKD